MNTSLKVFLISISAIAAILLITFLVFCIMALVAVFKVDSGESLPTDKTKYMSSFAGNTVFENSFDTMLPQTEIYDTVMKHFKDDNGLTKKAIILGWDGARADAMLAVSREGGISDLLSDGGHAYLMYTGNEEGSRILQDTSTAPGWATVLTGEWALKNMVYANYTPKMFCNTFLRELAQDGYKTSFNYLWTYHSYTYALEKYVYKTKNQTFNYIENTDGSDLETMETRLTDAVLSDIRSDKDVIFAIYESPDSIGHMNKFSPEDDAYMEGMQNINTYARTVINEIKARSTYDSEDWLIIIVPDHGGIESNHGSQTVECRTIAVVSNKTIEKE